MKGFWPLTMYNKEHFFEPNPIKRYSVGTKNKDLRLAADGSLTIYLQATEPTDAVSGPTGCRRRRRRTSRST